MSKILDYVVNNMNVNNNKQQELEVIDELLEKGVIFLNDPVKQGQKIENLSEFLVSLSVRDPLNKKLNELLDKYNIEKTLTGKQQYESLIHFLNSYSPGGEILENAWDEYSDKHPVSEDMIAVLKSYTDGRYESEKILSAIFERVRNSDDSVFLFNKIICEYIGLNTAEFFIKDYLDKKVDTLAEKYSSQLIAIVSFIPQIKKYKMKDGESLGIKFFKSHPDMYMESITDENERKELTDWYYAENFEKNNPDVKCIGNGKGNVSILLNRSDWFATRCGDDDIISFIIANENQKEVLMSGLRKKNSGLKEYLKNREKNVLVEYLSKSNEEALIGEYKTLSKKLPELIEREGNIDGVLDSLINGEPDVLLYKSEKFFTLLKSLPSAILLSSSSEKLLDWANSSYFYKMHRSDYDINKNKQYDLLFNLTLLALDKLFPKDANLKCCDPQVQEVRDKLCLQRNIRALNNMNYNGPPKTEENIAKIESSGLSVSSLKEMELIQILVNKEIVPADYLQERIVREEKELLNNSLGKLSQNDSLKAKKRI